MHAAQRAIRATATGEAADLHMEVALSTGRLLLAGAEGRSPLDSFCTWGARKNPRRGFLFVSELIGRYLPVRPKRLVAAQQQLAGLLPVDIEGPVLFLAVAEAGIALGSGVFDQWLRLTGRRDALYLQTSRHEVDRPLVTTFAEEHSHSQQHRIYQPDGPELQAMLHSARTLVVIDDEVSTGHTLINECSALLEIIASIRSVRHLVLTDWSGGQAEPKVRDTLGVPCDISSLWSGSYRFEPCRPLRGVSDPASSQCATRQLILPPGAEGRAGRSGSFRRSSHLELPCTIKRGERVLVLGTGELQLTPFALAAELEARGADAWFQATTRAPVLVEAAIRSRKSFADNYGGGFPCYLYNVNPGEYDHILYCQETPAETLPSELLEHLNAKPVLL